MLHLSALVDFLLLGGSPTVTPWDDLVKAESRRHTDLPWLTKQAHSTHTAARANHGLID